MNMNEKDKEYLEGKKDEREMIRTLILSSKDASEALFKVNKYLIEEMLEENK